MNSKVLWVIVGFTLGLVTLYIQNNTPLFKSNVRLLSDQPPSLIRNETKNGDKYRERLLELEFNVENSGFKSGSLGKVLLAPNDLRDMQNVKVVSFYRGDIAPFETKKASITIIVNENYAPNTMTYPEYLEYYKNKKGFVLEFYDEYGTYAGKLSIYSSEKAPPIDKIKLECVENK